MTTTPEPWTPTSAEPDYPSVSLTLGSDRPALLPEKSALPRGLAVSRRTRFTVPADGAAALQARTVVRPALRLLLGSDDDAERLRRRIETCLAEMAAVAYACTTDEHLLCSVWLDPDHVFVSVEHDLALPAVPDDSTVGLSLVKSIADEYGTHVEQGTHQTWAAVRRL
ncbi:hypothetical protein ABZ352_18685 [Streptomyces griseofuscus]|uniref:hypothetical protein n=1 Tax=Streptomyces griseofuscus TaxID=146922 RepID=UPI0033ECED9E